ncbi:MAG: OmpA/MotB family protein [Actinomycetota bacterium]
MAGGGGADARWLISYADLVTLLTAFFIALFGISQADADKFDKFVGGLGPFGNPRAEGILDGGTGIVGATDAIKAVGTDVAGVTGGIEATGNFGAKPHLATKAELPEIQKAIEAELARKGFPDAVDFDQTRRGLVTSVATDRVLFDSGSTHISERGAQIVGAIATTLNKLTNEVLVEGHTDNVPLNRAGYDNWNLSTDRAVAVAKLLQRRYGIRPQRLAATGYGEYSPKAGNSTDVGRAINRRVEIVIVAKNQKKSPQLPGEGKRATDGVHAMTPLRDEDHTEEVGHGEEG